MNDIRVNSTLNIQLPVTLESTRNWFERIQTNNRRKDFSFIDEGVVVAMGGFTEIDLDVKKAELYIFVNPDIQGKGYGTKSVRIMCQFGFEYMGLEKIYLHTNSDNHAARRLYEKIGFTLEGYMPHEVINNGKVKDRCYYGLYKNKEINSLGGGYVKDNQFFMCHDVSIDGVDMKIIRDDLFPAVGGGNKGRKAVEYERELKRLGCDAMVTTGGIQSNHNRAMALLAAKNGWKCHLVYHGTEERFNSENGNALLVRLSGATTEFVEANGISSAMDKAMSDFVRAGFKPYYVTGGGHDIPGGMAYVKAVQQLYSYAQLNNYKPKYIFHASGTGSTQAGILVGLELAGWSDVTVIGISVARQYERGKQVITEFTNELARHCGLHLDFTDRVHFVTDYLYGGYERYTPEMKTFLDSAMRDTGVIFDTTYSGKAFYGMMDYVEKNKIEDGILFWHTGGLMNIQK